MFFMKLVKVLGVSIMINGISVCVVVDYHEKIFGTLSNDTKDVVFGILFSRLVIYFGSAASWRPCNVVRPHQGLVPHSCKL